MISIIENKLRKQ